MSPPPLSLPMAKERKLAMTSKLSYDATHLVHHDQNAVDSAGSEQLTEKLTLLLVHQLCT